MKKTLSTFMFAAVFASAVSAAAPSYFNVSISMGETNTYTPHSDTAGYLFPVNITAMDSGNQQVTGFSGIVGISSSLGDINIEGIAGNTLTTAFTTGVWSGNIQILAAAASLTITCVDPASGAVGTFVKTVVPNSYAKPLIIMDGMTWAPGTVSGYTGSAISQTTTTPFSVTVLAVDAWNNTIYSSLSNYPTVRLDTSCPLTNVIEPSAIINMSLGGKAETLYRVTLNPSPDDPGTRSITLRDTTDPFKTDIQSMWFNSLTSYYMWAEAPASAVAGKDFNVIVKISHSQPSPEGVGIAGLTDNVQIQAIDFAGNSLTPGLISSNLLNGQCDNGSRTFSVHYTKSSPNGVTGIQISPLYIDVKHVITNVGNLSADSGVIVIYADAPASFAYTADKVKLKRNENSVLSVKISDQYSNPVSNTAVDFTVTTGSGILSDGLGNTWAARSVNTNLYGYAFITVTAQSNTITSISAAVSGIAGTQTMEIEFADIIDNNKVRNFPNPFNPLQGPTTIEYYLDDDSAVTMKLYSFSGSLVWNKDIPAGVMGGRKGYNPYVWDGTTDRHMPIGVGVYTLKIEVKANKGKYTLTRKIAVKK